MINRLVAFPIAAMVALTLTFAADPAVAREKARSKPTWTTYFAPFYGFSMKVPKGTKFKDKEWKDGWAGVHANYRGVQLWGVTHKGVKHTVPQFQVFGLIVTGIPGDKWEVVEERNGKNGFEWFKVHRAKQGKHVVFALYGVGEKGSYMLVLKITQKSFKQDKEQYLRWYRSITV